MTTTQPTDIPGLIESRQGEMIRARQSMRALGYSESDIRDEQLRIAGRYRRGETTPGGMVYPLEELKAALYDGAPDVADLTVTPPAYHLILSLCWADRRPEGLWGRTVAQ